MMSVRKLIMMTMLTLVITVGSASLTPSSVQAGGAGQPTDWNNFNHYPYVYYPQNFQRPTTYNNMYFRYPAERRIPVYNKDWHNFYLMEQPYHMGYHDILDVF
jgi:hypothetical protein